MKHLLNRTFIVFLCILIFGCQSVFETKTFQIKDQELHVIEITTDRVMQQCLFLNAEGDGKWRHQYLMFLLSNKNEVLEVADPLNMDQESCLRQLSKIEQILKSTSRVSVCIRDEFKKKRTPSDSWAERVDFGTLGSYSVEYESFTTDTICNSKECYGDNSTYTYTCPGFSKK